MENMPLFLSECTYNRENFLVLKDCLQHEQAEKNRLLNETVVLKEETLFLKESLKKAEDKVQWFEEQVKLAKQKRFGRQTETSRVIQQAELPLFDELENDVVEEKIAETQTQFVISHHRRIPKKGRSLDTSVLPRKQVLHDLENKTCSGCGKILEKIGEDHSEQIDYVPAKLCVIEHITPKYCCRHCETVQQAKKPEQLLPKSMATPSLMTEVIIAKYEHHTPLYRKAKMFEQEGLCIPDNTLGNWVMGSGEALMPLGEAQWTQVKTVNVLQADETPVLVITEKKKQYMWCYHSCDPKNRWVIFDHQDSRSQEAVNQRLSYYKGILQTDGYAGYSSLREKEGVIALGCWAHCRRKYAEIVQVHHTQGEGQKGLNFINQLYQIEKEAKDKELSFEQRRQLRQEKAKPILAEMKKWADTLQPKTFPQSLLGKAIGYTLSQWEYLERYIDYGEAEIDNNWVENLIRPFALGRKNWLFMGNEHGAKVGALFYSLIQTCHLNQINARTYLNCVLGYAGKIRRKEVDPTSLLPQFIDRALFENSS